jgi:hypothetical protein
LAYLTEADVRARASRKVHAVGGGYKTARRILQEDTAPQNATFDIFLSHSSAEPEEILLGIKAFLEDAQLSVYVDRYSDPQLTPEDVTSATAEILRRRMRNSGALLYVHSRFSKKSRWMPWELGFFDGLKGRVGIIPVTQNQEEAFKGEEYLNLYPHVDIAVPTGGGTQQQFWINKTATHYAGLARWVRGAAMTDHQ